MTNLESSREPDKGSSADGCGECPVAAAGRRAFLREVGLAVVGALALGATSRPGVLLAETISETRAARRRGAERSYAIPSGDAISIDIEDEVIIARWEDRVYAFSLRCPHRGARLQWRADERRVFCPKHKARFNPDGVHDSGRRSRDLDRYDIARAGSSILVNLDALRRADREPEAWRAAVVVLD